MDQFSIIIWLNFHLTNTKRKEYLKEYNQTYKRPKKEDNSYEQMKAQQIQDAATELVNYAVEKGTPVLEKSANAIREKAIQTTKDVLKKLETKEEK